jgi:hypothetical protein
MGAHKARAEVAQKQMVQTELPAEAGAEVRRTSVRSRSKDPGCKSLIFRRRHLWYTEKRSIPRSR